MLCSRIWLPEVKRLAEGKSPGLADSVSRAPLPHHPALCPCGDQGLCSPRSRSPSPPAKALTNARLRRNPREPQVEDHTPDIEHATDLGGEGESEATGAGGGGRRDPKGKHTSPCPQSGHGIRHLGRGTWVLPLL